MRSDQQQAINRLAGTSATAFLCAVLCVYPLYIDKFSNLGVTKFTGCFTLFLLFLLWLVACTAIGARAPRPRNANAGRDVTLWGVLAFAGTSLISTFTSLSPTASTWGLGGYYGGHAGPDSGSGIFGVQELVKHNGQCYREKAAVKVLLPQG